MIVHAIALGHSAGSILFAVRCVVK
jgi:hypothetical protein